VLGGYVLFGFPRSFLKVNEKQLRTFLSVLLIIFFLLESGLLCGIIKDAQGQISPFNMDFIETYGDASRKIVLHNYLDNDRDVSSARWLSKHRNMSYHIYADQPNSEYPSYELISYGMINHEDILKLTPRTKITDKSYIYLRYLNVIDDLMYSSKYGIFNISDMLHQNDPLNVIYTNGGSEILLKE
jgi:uncharacterized membrane protein